jgi:hypothetical protein
MVKSSLVCLMPALVKIFSAHSVVCFKKKKNNAPFRL